MTDRYLKIVLTVIALELGWIAVKDAAVPVSAQQPQTVRAIVAGVDIDPDAVQRGALPIVVRPQDAALRIQADAPGRPLKIETDRPIKVEGDRPLPISIDRPVKVEADQPLKIEQVPYTPGRVPGE